VALAPLFLDTGFVIALFNKDDGCHDKAKELLAHIEQSPVVTTQAILVEIGDAFVAPHQREVAWRFIDNLLAGKNANWEVVPVDTPLLTRGVELFKSRKDKTWGLTDCVSFVVMTDRNIREAVTCDEHYEQAGFVRLLVGCRT